MDDLISRQAAIDALNEKCLMPAWCKVLVKKMLTDLPSAEPQRKKGKWVKKNDAVCYWYECSVCGEKTPLSIHRKEWHSWYCPNCGADMRGEGDE